MHATLTVVREVWVVVLICSGRGLLLAPRPTTSTNGVGVQVLDSVACAISRHD